MESNKDLKRRMTQETYKQIARDFRSEVGKGNYVKYGEELYFSAIEAYSQLDPDFDLKFSDHVTNYVLFVHENHNKKSKTPALNLGVYLCNVLEVKTDQECAVLDQIKKDGRREFTPFTTLFKQWFALRPDLDRAKAILHIEGQFYWGRRLAANKSKTPSVVMTGLAYDFVQDQMSKRRPMNFEGHMHHPVLMILIVDQFRTLHDIDTEDQFISKKTLFLEFHLEKLRKAPLVPMSEEGHRNFHKLQKQLLKVFNRTPVEEDYLNVYRFMCENASIDCKYDYDPVEILPWWKQFLIEQQA